ncbi:MAG TPA: hypothetical protein VMG80_06895 [Solirubrobacteraceae bacterium]|nr:hypothetical protein [Solirubrobacteraceae bacterium]
MKGGSPERVVYGVILVGALIAAESGSHDGYFDRAVSTLLALAIYWLAHSYSTVLGRRLEHQKKLTLAGLGKAMEHDWGIVRGGAVPLIALLCCWALGASQETAVNVAIWAAVVSLIVFELVAGLRAKSTPRELAFEGAVGVAMGVAILALKTLAH